MEWFESWFDTPYYHLLYQHRDDREAHAFIDRLVHHLNINEDKRVLDVACGRGRHAIYLNQKGLQVTGIDLSEKSIDHAQQFANDRLRFFVRDMREPLKHVYDVMLNMFTSFGYFKTQEENRIAIGHLANALAPEGVLVIDFLNSKKALLNLVEDEEIQAGGITFRIRRSFENECFIKRIVFEDQGERHEYNEHVHALTLADFNDCFQDAGLQIVDTFGDYDLNPFHAAHSDRLILIAQKSAV